MLDFRFSIFDFRFRRVGAPADVVLVLMKYERLDLVLYPSGGFRQPFQPVFDGLIGFFHCIHQPVLNGV